MFTSPVRGPRLALLALGPAFLFACSDPGFRGVPDVREATPAEVASCAYVANISMKPGLYGALADEAVRYARNKIKEDARAGGANTVVFDQVTPGAEIYELRATAYRC